MNCTWKGCNQPGEYPQLDADGDEWTRLCHSHDFVLRNAQRPGGNPGSAIRARALARGDNPPQEVIYG